jgi:cysteine-rich repeat protein
MTSKICDWDCYPGYSGREWCGDGELGPGEVCDDGNTLSGDGCSGDCKTIEPGYFCPGVGLCTPIPTCGDGCDVAGAIAYGLGCTAGCERAPYCGDGIVQAEYGEQCDTGNPAAPPYAGCTFECKRGPYCGDGVVDVPFGESCDDGTANGTEGDACSSVCHPAVN